MDFIISERVDASSEDYKPIAIGTPHPVYSNHKLVFEKSVEGSSSEKIRAYATKESKDSVLIV